MAGGVGTGASVVFDSSSFEAQVVSFNIDGEEVSVLDVSHLGSTSYRSKIFGVLIEPPAITLEINFDPELPPPVGLAGEITVTWPDSTELTGSGTIVSQSSATPLEEKMTAQFVFQMDGVTGPSIS